MGGSGLREQPLQNLQRVCRGRAWPCPPGPGYLSTLSPKSPQGQPNISRSHLRREDKAGWPSQPGLWPFHITAQQPQEADEGTKAQCRNLAVGLHVYAYLTVKFIRTEWVPLAGGSGELLLQDPVSVWEGDRGGDGCRQCEVLRATQLCASKRLNGNFKVMYILPRLKSCFHFEKI